MNLIRLYGRVLALLGSEARLAWTLAIANIALASAQFAEPVLLGRIIDTLTAAQAAATPPSWSQLSVLLSAWAGFGLFTIACGTLIALYADRLSHRRRHVVLTGYFEHVLQLPLTYHGNTHSGRLMKVMLQGTDALWGLWIGFFRDNLASIVSLLVLLPISLFINWRLALLLIVLCVVFAALTALIVRKTQTLQSSVEQHYSDLAERASDTLGNIALVQSFSRLEQEVAELRQVVERLLKAQMPVLSWWALAAVLTGGAADAPDSPWPDLVLIDGGQGQLRSATETLTELGITNVPLVAIAKGMDREAGRETFFMAGRSPFKLPPRDPLLYFVERLRDEAHRFAIGSHRARRKKDIREAGLQEIAGIGPTRKRALLHHFGTVKAIERASLADLAHVPGINAETARKIYDFFHEKAH